MLLVEQTSPSSAVSRVSGGISFVRQEIFFCLSTQRGNENNKKTSKLYRGSKYFLMFALSA